MNDAIPAERTLQSDLRDRLLFDGTVLLAAFLLAWLSIALARESGNITYVWLPNALIYAVALRLPGRQWDTVALGWLANVLANVATGAPLLLSVELGFANLAEIVVGLVLGRRVVNAVFPLSLVAMLQLLGCFLILASPLGACLGGWVVHRHFGTDWLAVFQNWWLGEAIGILLLGVPALLINREFFRLFRQWQAVLDMAFTWLILTVLTYLVLRYIPFPFVYVSVAFTVIAYRDGALRTVLYADLVLLTLGLLLRGHYLALDSLTGVAGGKGIWAAGALTCLFPTLLGMAVESLREQQRQVARLTERLHLASEALKIGVWDWDIVTQEMHWDQQMRRLYQLDENSNNQLFYPQWQQRVHSDDLAAAEAALQAALRGEKDYDVEFRVCLAAGETRFIHASAVVVDDAETGHRRMVGVNWDVTSARRAEQARYTAQVQLQGVINAASEFAIISGNLDGLIEVFSEGAQRMLGYSAEEAIGKMSPAPFHVPSEVEARSRELSAELGSPVTGFDVFVEKCRSGVAEAREWTYVRKDGTTLPVRLVVTAIRDNHGAIIGYLGVAQDITEPKMARQAMAATNRVLEQQIAVAQRTRQEFESLFALAPGALLVVDADGKIVKANTQAHDLFGYADAVLERRPVEDLIPLDKRSTHSALRARFMQTSTMRMMAADRELSGMRRDGTHFAAEVSLGPLLINGAPCTIAIVRDVTEQKQAQEVLARARDEAESANRAKSEFLANMSHEIRTPLNAVLGTAQLLANLELNDQQQRYVGMIRRSGQSLLGVLNDILDFSKIEAGRMELAHEEFDLDDVLGTIATLMSVNTGNKEIELAIGVAPGTPQRLLGDALRLNQILTNMVGNAIKFTEQGEIVVRVEPLTVTAEQAVLKFSVQDTGIGMSVEQQGRIFQAFSQVDTSMTRRFGGSGLGLVISKRLIEQMGGTIQLRSEQGAGTEFSFTLVLGVASGQPVLGIEDQVADFRVLLVDDNATSRSILQVTIAQWGWAVDAVDNCESALQQFDAAGPGNGYNAVLADWKLPGIDALQQRVSESDDTALQRILMVSAYGLQRVQHADSWDARLIKPINASILFNTLMQRAPGRLHSLVIAPDSAPEDQLRGVHILLVEDNELNQVVACGLLEHAGALVDVVDNGHQAVEWLRSRPDQYQLVLMDVQMPVMDGFTATRLIREQLGLHLPIVAMSAGVMLVEQRQCLDSGMNGFIAKPVDYARMLDGILQHLPAAGADNGRDMADGKGGKGGDSPHLNAPEPAGGDDPDNALFCPDKLLGFVRGKPKRLRDVMAMIQKLVDQGTAPIEEGRQLWLAGNSADATRYFHTLKGSMGNLGAQQMWQAAEALEHAIKQAQGDIEALFQQGRSCLQQTVDAASVWLRDHPEYQANASEPASPLSISALQALRDKLAESNIGACDDFAALQQALRERLPEAQMTELQNAMQALDFPRATTLLTTLQP